VPVDYCLVDPLPDSLSQDLDTGYLNTLVLREAIVYHKGTGTVMVADAGVKVGGGLLVEVGGVVVGASEAAVAAVVRVVVVILVAPEEVLFLMVMMMPIMIMPWRRRRKGGEGRGGEGNVEGIYYTWL